MFVLFIARDTIFRRVAGISLVDRGGRVLCVYTRVLHSKTLYTANDSKWKFLPDLRNRQLTAYTTPSPFIKHSNTERWPSNRGVLSPPDKSPPMHHHFKDSRIFANFPTSYRSFASYTRTIRVVRIYIYRGKRAAIGLVRFKVCHRYYRIVANGRVTCTEPPPLEARGTRVERHRLTSPPNKYPMIDFNWVLAILPV